MHPLRWWLEKGARKRAQREKRRRKRARMRHQRRIRRDQRRSSRERAAAERDRDQRRAGKTVRDIAREEKKGSTQRRIGQEWDNVTWEELKERAAGGDKEARGILKILNRQRDDKDK